MPDEALLAAGILRDEVYATKAVKHFKFAQRGKRIHQSPSAIDAAALVTIHPSWLLRMPDPAMKARERERFVDKLKLAVGLVKMAA